MKEKVKLNGYDDDMISKVVQKQNCVKDIRSTSTHTNKREKIITLPIFY